MPSIQYLLFSILMLLFLGAIVVFTRYVIRPIRIHWAISEARKMVARRDSSDNWRSRNICRKLATDQNDLEAAELWKQLKDIKEISENWA
jgi:hypothetical protein